ncbi:MAG: hypothetical protein ABI175_15025 [Polyangiales bacterium]
MSADPFPPGSCVVCGHAEVASLEAIVVRGQSRLACRTHAAVARETRPRSIAALRRACAPAGRPGERRGAAGRRDSTIDRRAFWRPTPDRRAEATERGRRTGDA